MVDRTIETVTLQERLVGGLRGPLGGLVARPWLDPVALKALALWFFPLSRLWAAARAAEGSVEAFFQEVPLAPTPKLTRQLSNKLEIFERERWITSDLEAKWEEAFFGSHPTAGSLADVEARRLDQRHRYNGLRRQFIPIRLGRRIPGVRWRVPSPGEAGGLAEYPDMDQASLFAAPNPMPRVARSRDFVTGGLRTYWLRFHSPDILMGDEVTARVYEPVGVTNPPTLIFGHGVCIEFDHWRGMVDEVAAMVDMGIRVVRPEAPWHGWRVIPGHFGGEQMIATAPLGTLHHFTAAIREWSVLIDWARGQSNAPVAVGGSSLGSMTAQLVAHKSRHWPENLRPDAMILVTHCGQLVEALRDGALAKQWRAEEAMAQAGWSLSQVEATIRPLHIDGPPVMPGGNIVSVLGDRDTVTPFAGGKRYVARAGLPAENLFIYRRGHFSIPVGILRDERPLQQFKRILDRLGGS